MNQKEINDIIRRYDLQGINKHINCIKHDPNVTEEHIDAVNHICKICLINKQPFVTRFKIPSKNNKHNIPDIVLINTPLIGIEILKSERLKDFKKKLKKLQEGVYLHNFTIKEAKNIKRIEQIL
jgi:hypothetical protein